MRLALLIVMMLVLSGCETLRIGLATDFGTFSYEVPVRTLQDK